MGGTKLNYHQQKTQKKSAHLTVIVFGWKSKIQGFLGFHEGFWIDSSFLLGLGGGGWMYFFCFGPCRGVNWAFSRCVDEKCLWVKCDFFLGEEHGNISGSTKLEA